MKYPIIIIALVLLLAAPALAQNMLVNGDFEKGQKNNEPIGWHSKITGIITVSEWKDPDNKKGLLGKYFKDGCGHIWGRIRRSTEAAQQALERAERRSFHPRSLFSKGIAASVAAMVRAPCSVMIDFLTLTLMPDNACVVRDSLWLCPV